jgi:hypothetical protein
MKRKASPATSHSSDPVPFDYLVVGILLVTSCCVRPAQYPASVRLTWSGPPKQLGNDSARKWEVQSPLAACLEEPSGPRCAQVFKELKNPYYLGDEVGLTQTLGWVDGWTSKPSTTL